MPEALSSALPMGIYIHIPFCVKKCGYCDFYSCFPTSDITGRYLASLRCEIARVGKKFDGRSVNTVYFGGGTPSLLGKDIIPLMTSVRESFNVTENAEITAEVNPGIGVQTFLHAAAQCGINRISVGVQSGDNKTLKILGRTHTAEDSQRCLEIIRREGIDNISIDLITALPDSSIESLDRDIDFILSMNPRHVSAYILKIEKNTRFGLLGADNLPDDDETAKQYMHLCRRMNNAGFLHYEISSFALPGAKSRHNLKYWRCEEYVGIGAAAHSFTGGRRYYYPRDIKEFISHPRTVPDGDGGSPEEQLMLALRLSSGVNLSSVFPEITPRLRQKTQALYHAGLIDCRDFPHISLTERGMLVSNSIITELLL